MITIGEALDSLLKAISTTKGKIKDGRIEVYTSSELFFFKLVLLTPANYELAFPKFGLFTVQKREIKINYPLYWDGVETYREYSMTLFVERET